MLGWSAVLPQFANSSLLTILLHIVLYCWHLRESQLNWHMGHIKHHPCQLDCDVKTVTYGQLCKHQPCQPWVQGECTRLTPRDSEASSRKMTVWLQPSHWVHSRLLECRWPILTEMPRFKKIRRRSADQRRRFSPHWSITQLHKIFHLSQFWR